MIRKMTSTQGEIQTRAFRAFHAAAFLTLSIGLMIAMAAPYGALAQSRTEGPATLDVGRQQKADIIDSASQALNDIYVFPEVAIEIEALLRQNLSRGDYDEIATLGEFTDRLTDDFQAVSSDKHLHIHPMEPRQPAEADPEAQAERERSSRERMRRSNYAFKKLEILPSNIGYVRFDGFVDAADGGATAVAAMNFVANADAIIFDLRQNGGGSPSMIQLITSYLLTESTHINSFYIRKDDTIRQFWTQSYVEGPRLSDVPVYVLTSDYTFSAAEEFTYNLKNLGRATIVGETTGGGAHPTEGVWFRIDDAVFVEMSVPFGRAINPISGTNWEGTGIEPHIQVPADQALTAAQLDFFKKSREQEADSDRLFAIDWAIEGLQVELEPIGLTSDAAGEYTGQYGPRRIFLDAGVLYYQREDRPRYRLIPMSSDRFGLEDLDYFRVEFVRDDSGRVIEIDGLYDNGARDSHIRDDGPSMQGR
jgi:hypothetical protein